MRQHAVGSGVIVDSNGYIMTNAHVVEGAQRIRVALPMSSSDSAAAAPLPAGRRQLFDAKVLGIHKESDLALLKIDQTNLPTLSLEAPQNIRVGQMVLAVGSPEGLQSSVTMGVISAVARQADPTKSLNYVQTDAPINPGNSGGPLVDMNGYVVGINTFILSQSGGSEGLGFAIPARVVNFVYHSLRKYGHVHHVEIGAGAQEITPTLAEGLGLPQSWGVIVDDITPDGPAASAGLQVQDIILTADDRPIETMSALTAATYLHNPDHPVKLEILRGEEKEGSLRSCGRKARPDGFADGCNRSRQESNPATGGAGGGYQRSATLRDRCAPHYRRSRDCGPRRKSHCVGERTADWRHYSRA